MKFWIDECLSPTLVERANRRIDLHTGLLILPQTQKREAVWPLFNAALDYIEQHATDANETAAEWMLNKSSGRSLRLPHPRPGLFDASWERRIVARRLRRKEKRCSVHLPFVS